MTDLNALAERVASSSESCSYPGRYNVGFVSGNERDQIVSALRTAASSQAGVAPVREAIDPWVDTRLVTFDATIVFGHGGLDFDRWEGLRSECHTRHGSFAIWKSGRHSWSIYGGKYGLLALDRYSSERQAKEEVSQLLLSYDNEAEAVAPALTASDGNAAPEAATPASTEPVAWPYPKSLHWLGDREDATKTGHATDMRGCVMYFEQQSDCLQFMRLLTGRALSTPAPAQQETVQLSYCRPEVIAFARLMETELRANDHKPGWKDDYPDVLARRVQEEATELLDAAVSASIHSPVPIEDRKRVAEEAADVANMAMMVADVCGCLDTAPAQPNTDTEDAIVTDLYRRFKDWSKRGFGPDDVTWCEVKADVRKMIAQHVGAPAQQAVDVEAVKHAQPAIDNLINHQEQCDQDGVMVKVSRQALDEVLALINGVRDAG